MNKELVYGAFADYYGGSLRLRLIKNDNGWMIYGAKVSTGLSLQRYIFVVVQQARSLGEYAVLDSLDWVSFQTRTTEDTHAVPEYALPIDQKRKEALKDQITMVERTNTVTRYVTPELPIKISLMHDLKKRNTLQYPDKAKLYQALETYNCIIDLL